MNKELITTRDGSHSIFIPSLNEIYHSRHGSIQESMHVFIKNGMMYHKKKKVNILEIGLGTGLNAFLTFKEKYNKDIYFVSLEPYPICKDIYTKLNFTKIIKDNNQALLKIHDSRWEKDIKISDDFTIHKTKSTLQKYFSSIKFDIIYFDAFAPEKQPDMWQSEILKKCFLLLNQNGFLVTYCAKGSVKRTMSTIGFEIESLPGPIGKREMIRASRI